MTLAIRIGTNEIPAHHLGDIRWTRQMPGATAGVRCRISGW